jgi:hypothetical protein
LRERLKEHEDKIAAEQSRPGPNEDVIRYWEKEMRAFEDGIARARKRLRRR